MFPLITIAGPAYARGMQYGRQAAAQIRHSIASYARLFAFCSMDWATVQDAALPYEEVIGSFDAELLDEIRGIAVGAERTLAEILALNARTELLPPSFFVGPASPRAPAAYARNRAAGVPEHGECTAVAVQPAASANGGTWLAQNWDWTGDQRAACVVLRVEVSGRPTVLTLTEAGMLAKIGLNEAGFGVCLNILRSRLDGQVPGVPVHVLLRALLGVEDVAAAERLALGIRPGASSNMLCADRGGHAASMELTPGGSGVLRPSGGLLVHTNHCLAPETCPVASPVDPISSTVPRYEQAEALLRPLVGRIDRAALVELLRDESQGALSICRRPDMQLPPPARVESVAGVVMDLVAGMLEIAPGIPADVEFQRVA